MKIGGFDINLPKINKNTKVNKPLANLNEPIQDTFTSSKKINKVSEKEALKQVSEMKNADGSPRFSQKEINSFKIANATGFIDLDTVKAFKDNTDFDMNTMKAVYAMKRDLNDENFNDKVVEAISKLPNGMKPVTFVQSIYEPTKEFSLEDKNSTVSYKFDAKTSEMLSKSKSTSDFSDGLVKVTKTTDLKNNAEIMQKRRYDYDAYAYRLLEQKIIRNDKNGKMIREESITQSDVAGVYDVKYTYPNGKTQQLSKGTIDRKTGIVSVKKDMVSENGTRTQYLYENDPKGNRIIDYKITDKNGKILMGNSQTFEVIDDNHFISSKNGYKYDIKTDDKKLTVKDLHHDKEVSLDFENKLTGNKKNVINLLKNVSGEELFEAIANVKKIEGIKNAANGSFSPAFKSINVGDNLYVFLHELGHAKDAQNQKTTKEKMLGLSKMFTDNKDIQETYLKEREMFNKTHSDDERRHIDYFIQAKDHYQGEFGGLGELVAETNALTNTFTDGKSQSLGARSQYLQQYFPETIAKIHDAMNWKDDLTAIEYYGT